jgi:glutamate synthase domain-containing protein 3
LENWNTTLPKFVKVFPHEFRKALEKRKAQAAAAFLPVGIVAQPALQQVHG